jgi:hypothetical protein
MDMIDLSLAVNYLPACACIGKTVALAFVLCVIHAGGMIPAYVPVAAALMLDRLLSATLIMDGNSVLLGVLASHLVWEVQRSADGRWEPWSGLPLLLSAVWPMGAAWCLWGKYRITGATRLQEQRIAFAEAAAVVGALAFLRAEEELRIVRFARYLAFACLCLAWVYAIGLYQRRMIHPSDSAVHFTIYFSPILYVHQYAALAYAAFCLVSIGANVHTQQAAGLLPTGGEPDPPPPPPDRPPRPEAQSLPPEEDLEELERIYRMTISGGKSSV